MTQMQQICQIVKEAEEAFKTEMRHDGYGEDLLDQIAARFIMAADGTYEIVADVEELGEYSITRGHIDDLEATIGA